jgi:hypothetical protein
MAQSKLKTMPKVTLLLGNVELNEDEVKTWIISEEEALNFMTAGDTLTILKENTSAPFHSEFENGLSRVSAIFNNLRVPNGDLGPGLKNLRRRRERTGSGAGEKAAEVKCCMVFEGKVAADGLPILVSRIIPSAI